MNVVPVVLGSGRPFFGAMGPGDTVVLGNPSLVARGDRVTHLLDDVTGTVAHETPADDGAVV